MSISPDDILPINEQWARVPEHLQGGLRRYFTEGIRPGSFLTAVLSNDLKSAVCYADGEALPALPQIVRYLVNYVPTEAWGSRTAFERWLNIMNAEQIQHTARAQ